LPSLLQTIDFDAADLVKDQEQSYGLQAALALEPVELFHQEVPVGEVMVPMPAVPSLDSSSHSPAGRSPRLSEGREGCDELVAEGEVWLPLGQSSLPTLAAFFSEYESPSHLKAFAVDFVDPDGEKVLKRVLSSEGNDLLRQVQGGQGEDRVYQGGRMGLADRWTGPNQF